MPKRDLPRIRAQITEAQDSAIDRVAGKLTKRRGNTVSRADVTREALALYFRKIEEEWPTGTPWRPTRDVP